MKYDKKLREMLLVICKRFEKKPSDLLAFLEKDANQRTKKTGPLTTPKKVLSSEDVIGEPYCRYSSTKRPQTFS